MKTRTKLGLVLAAAVLGVAPGQAMAKGSTTRAQTWAIKPALRAFKPGEAALGKTWTIKPKLRSFKPGERLKAVGWTVVLKRLDD